MSYSVACDALARLTTVAHGASALTGPVGINLDKLVAWKVIKEGGNNFPACLALDMLSGEVRVRFMGGDSGINHTAAAANIVATFKTGDEDIGTITIGPFKAGDITSGWDDGAAAVIFEQVFSLQGNLVYTISM
ncbi:MAG: hypothetical protein V3T31_08045 [candidate division Zixibacteria bacterium]